MNKYKLDFIQWITGLPKEIAKTVTNLKLTSDGISYRAKFPISSKDWRCGYGSNG